MGNDKRIRTDHEGLKHKKTDCKGSCNCKADRGQLAAPRKLDVDRLIKLCDDVYINRTVDTLSDSDRRDLEILLVVLDGEPIKKPYNPHPSFLTGIVRHAYARKGNAVPAPTKRDATPAPAKPNKEADARASMNKATRDAWKRTK